MDRKLLPTRRLCETLSGSYRGHAFTITVGFTAEGDVAEFFGNASKADSELERTLSDAAIAISLALQFGATVGQIAKTISNRAEGREPSSIVAAAVDLLAVYEREAPHEA